MIMTANTRRDGRNDESHNVLAYKNPRVRGFSFLHTAAARKGAWCLGRYTYPAPTNSDFCRALTLGFATQDLRFLQGLTLEDSCTWTGVQASDWT